jgi:hypothetical protein
VWVGGCGGGGGEHLLFNMKFVRKPKHSGRGQTAYALNITAGGTHTDHSVLPD